MRSRSGWNGKGKGDPGRGGAVIKMVRWPMSWLKFKRQEIPRKRREL